MTHQKNKMKVSILATGVIGAGWAARFLLSGYDVHVFDPSPDAQQQLEKVIANARKALKKLFPLPSLQEGKLFVCNDLTMAIKDADYIQESAPERLEIKQNLYHQIEQIVSEHTIIASSTSGFTPTQLRQGLLVPDRVIVAHPFNPVYLLPLVELVGGQNNNAILRAKELLEDIGMHALIIRKEIDAHIADRLLESVWRESLWLIKDDVATTEEIDDSIRFGFGLRWAQMGLFETYRLAGGERGMAHFLAQFGPSLKWPWTRLMDVPELDKKLIQKIEQQSNAQSGMHDITTLEQIRDNNIINFLQSLKANQWGAGKAVLKWEQSLKQGAFKTDPVEDLSLPLILFRCNVRSEWIDYNQHMTEYRYGHVFADASDAFLAWLGLDDLYLQTTGSFYTLENQIRFLAEIKLNSALYVQTQLLGYDAKKLRLLHHLYVQGSDRLSATCDSVLIHVEQQSGKVNAMSLQMQSKLMLLWKYHTVLERPEHVGMPMRDITPN